MNLAQSRANSLSPQGKTVDRGSVRITNILSLKYFTRRSVPYFTRSAHAWFNILISSSCPSHPTKNRHSCHLETQFCANLNSLVRKFFCIGQRTNSVSNAYCLFFLVKSKKCRRNQTARPSDFLGDIDADEVVQKNRPWQKSISCQVGQRAQFTWACNTEV